MSGTVRIDGDKLVFELHGMDEFLAFKRSMSVPLEHIVAVSTDKVDWAKSQRVRMVGSSIPGVVKDGRFLTSDEMMFFEMHNPDKCITVSLDHERYKKIVFEVEDKETVAMIIQTALDARG